MDQQSGAASAPEVKEQKKKGNGGLKKFWKKRKKPVIVVGIVAVIGLTMAMKSLAGGDSGAMMVTTSPASRQTVAETVVIKGTIEGSETAEITSALNNKILAINVKEGDRVTKDQVLAELDGEDLKEALTVAQDQYDQSRYTPVSYTHLDVYKRQGHDIH